MLRAMAAATIVAAKSNGIKFLTKYTAISDAMFMKKLAIIPVTMKRCSFLSLLTAAFSILLQTRRYFSVPTTAPYINPAIAP